MAKIQGNFLLIRLLAPLYFILSIGYDPLSWILDSFLHDYSSKNQWLCGWGAGD